MHFLSSSFPLMYLLSLTDIRERWDTSFRLQARLSILPAALHFFNGHLIEACFIWDFTIYSNYKESNKQEFYSSNTNSTDPSRVFELWLASRAASCQFHWGITPTRWRMHYGLIHQLGDQKWSKASVHSSAWCLSDSTLCFVRACARV